MQSHRKTWDSRDATGLRLSDKTANSGRRVVNTSTRGGHLSCSDNNHRVPSRQREKWPVRTDEYIGGVPCRLMLRVPRYLKTIVAGVTASRAYASGGWLLDRSIQSCLTTGVEDSPPPPFKEIA